MDTNKISSIVFEFYFVIFIFKIHIFISITESFFFLKISHNLIKKEILEFSIYIK